MKSDQTVSQKVEVV